jgi:CheY-like chemotaxis protein
VSSGLEAVEVARDLQPRVAILDADMPRLDGYAACKQIKSELDLDGCRVMLVVTGVLSSERLQRLASAGADDLIVVPVDEAEFLAHLAELLGVPRRRSPRMRVELLAWVSAGVQVWAGRVDDLSLHGARVSLERPLAEVETVRLRLVPAHEGEGVALDARVVWRREDGRLVGLDFGHLPPDQRTRLETLALWEVVEEDGVMRVYLQGAFNETTDFASLAGLVAPRLDFDAAGLRYINSHGAHRWTSFLEGLGGVEEYTFSRCSQAFTTQACLFANFLGRGRVLSFLAPYRCEQCDRDEIRLLQTAAVVAEGDAHVPPRFRCRECGGSLVFDDMPARFLAFLQKG